VELDKIIFVPHTDKEYRRLIAFLDHSIDEVGEDEAHPLASLMELVGVLIERYEDEHVPELASEAEEEPSLPNERVQPTWRPARPLPEPLGRVRNHAHG
jgi:HTH-type transcriptional regulator / antitoxin HigA